MKKISLLLIFLFICGLLFISTRSAHAAASYYPANLGQWRAVLRSGFMAGSGYSTGYTDYFLPLIQNETRMVFFTPKAAWTDDSSNEQNIGLGYRWLNYAETLILGGNVFFDTRRSTYGNRLNQVGTGLEFLTQWVDARVNYYHPLDKAKRVTAEDTYALGHDSLLYYEGFEEPLEGLDYELGFLIPGVSNFIEARLYLGGYFYNSKKFEDVSGERLRLELTPTRYLTLEMKTDFGHEGKTNSSYGGFVTLPFDIGNIFKMKNPFAGWQDMLGFGHGPRELIDRMTDRVVRDLDIVRRSGPTVNSREQQKLIYVDNSNTTGTEDGTLEHPHNTLAEAFTDSRYAPGAWVYVNKGDGTATGYTGNYALANNVVLWGSGYDGGYKGVPVPGFPMIDGGGAAFPVITLADNNTVMGVDLQHGKFGISAENKNGSSIRYNDISHNSEEGILIYNSGTGTMSDFIVTGNTITGNTKNAIFVYNLSTGTFSNFTFSDNTMTGNTGDGMFVVNQGGGTMNDLTFSRNQASGNGKYGICFYNVAAGTMSRFTIDDNILNGNTWYGMNVYNQTTGSYADFIFTGNMFAFNQMDGLDLYNQAGGHFSDFTFTRNIFRANEWDGVYLSKATGTMSGINFGNGVTGGYNSLYDNVGYYDDGIAITNLSGIVNLPAENNWWGEDAAPVAKVFGSVDYGPWLHAAP